MKGLKEDNSIKILIDSSMLSEVYEIILDLKDDVELLKKELIQSLDLTKRNDVRKYLNISESTLMNMMNDGRLKRGKHYTKDIKGSKPKITFIESAIIDFKEKR